mgnify:CR=1 FL=1
MRFGATHWAACAAPLSCLQTDALLRFHRAVVVAVVAVGVMQVAVDEVIDVIAVRDRFVAAIGAVDMPVFVTAA